MTEPLDIEASRERASRLSQLGNERLQRVAIGELTIEALLDIAQSLRFVAAEAAIAMGEAEPSYMSESEDDEPQARARTLAEHVKRGGDPMGWLIDGDLVTPREAAVAFKPLRVLSVGIAEGQPVAEIESAGKAWQSDLALALVGVATPAESVALAADDDGDGDEAVGGYELNDEAVAPEDLVDDIDNDFDGDPHAVAEDAVERLREAEAARKAAKKGKKK